MGTNTVAVTDKSFLADVVEASKKGPVLVDFWAEWCGPCKMIGPALEELAGEFAGKLTVAKVDIDDNPKSPGDFGVRGIPTLILFKDGKAAGDPVTKLGKMRASLRGHLERCGAAMASAEIDRRLDELAATLQKSWGVDLGY